MSSVDPSIQALITPTGSEFLQPRVRLRPNAVPHAFELTRTKPDKVTRAQVQQALAELTGTLYAEVIEWIRDVADINPQRAVEIFIELLEFTVPKVKAVDVRVTAHSDADLKSLSMAELQHSIVSEQ